MTCCTASRRPLLSSSSSNTWRGWLRAGARSGRVGAPAEAISTTPARRSAWSMRWWCCRSSPAFLGLLGADWARLGGVLALIKIARYARAIPLVTTVFRNEGRSLLAALNVMLVLLLIAATIMYMLEHNAQPQLFSSIPATPVVGHRHDRDRRLWRHDADHHRRPHLRRHHHADRHRHVRGARRYSRDRLCCRKSAGAISS